ncbi:MAG: triose-phosphate isomerase [Pseudomonadota bacterium]
MAFAKPVVLGNWKMNGLRSEGLALVGALADRAIRLQGTLGVFPPSTLLSAVKARVGNAGLIVGGQDCHDQTSGAYTGSISAPMLVDSGAQAVLVGHSERRHGLGEDDELVGRKVLAAHEAGLIAVLCVGETESEYVSGERDNRLSVQLNAAVPANATAENLLIAYEPVWAIGTGRTPSIDDIAATHGFLRQKLGEYATAGADIAILYGGSVKPSNASEIMATKDVDGVLVGGASLEAESFWSIYTAGGGA